MRTIGTIVLTIALANMLALAGIIGWLVTSDRLDAERMRDIRQVFSETVTARESRQSAEEAKAKQEEQAKVEAAKAKEPPVTGKDKLDVRLEKAEADEAKLEKMRQESRQLQAAIASQIADLESLRQTVQKEREAYEQLRAQHAASDGSAQFKKALTTLEGLKPDKVKQVLQQLLDTKRPEDAEQVISYLNGMQERTRVKVLDEFAKTDAKLASDLLERLRVRGLAPREPASAPANGESAPVSGPK